MGFIDKFLPPKEIKFYSSFEEGAELCSKAAQLYYDVIFYKLSEERLINALDIKAKSVFIAKNTLNELNKTFITPIDREDILDIAFLLNKIAKRIVRSCLNIKVYHLKEHSEIMRQQAETLLLATKELQKVVSYLKKDSALKEITESNHKIIEIETHGDNLLLKAMDEIFSGKYEALDVIKLRDIYRTVESALDNCFNVSDSILNIAIKHD